MASKSIYYIDDEIEKYKNAEISNLCDNEMKENKNNKHQIRDNFKNILMTNLGLGELEATDLEIGIFNATIDYAIGLKIHLSWKCQMLINIYLNISRSVYSNLKGDSYVGNKQLLERLTNKKEFLPHMLPYMLCQDIFPDRWKQIIEKNQLRLKAAYEVKNVAMSDMITCSRCKGKKVSYYELQTRSGDEASTLFMNCLICGKKWKQ